MRKFLKSAVGTPQQRLSSKTQPGLLEPSRAASPEHPPLGLANTGGTGGITGGCLRV